MRKRIKTQRPPSSEMRLRLDVNDLAGQMCYKQHDRNNLFWSFDSEAAIEFCGFEIGDGINEWSE